MNKDDVIRMARETGLIVDSPYLMPHDHVMHGIERFAQAAYDAGAAAAQANEREACAKVLDEMAAQDKRTNYYGVAANAIRARGQA